MTSRGWMRISLVATLAIATQLFAQTDPGQQAQLQIATFDAPHAGGGSGQGTYPQDNNSAGTIAGYYITWDNVFHGFLRATDGTITSFDPPGSGTLKGSAQGTVPQSINTRGDIAGQYQDENYLYHGFLRAADGTFTTFDSPNAGTTANQGTFGENINRAGTISGFYLDANNVYHGFVRARDGAITTFDDPNAGSGAYQGTVVTFEEGMNEAGTIIGWYVDSSNVQHGYERAPDGTFTTIDGPGPLYSLLGGVTPEGAITGYFADVSSVYHGFLYVDGTLTQFDDPQAGTGAGQGTAALTINPAKAITGIYIDANNVLHGFVRSPKDVFTTIDVPGAIATRPETINPADAITGYFVTRNGVAHGFVRTP